MNIYVYDEQIEAKARHDAAVQAGAKVQLYGPENPVRYYDATEDTDSPELVKMFKSDSGPYWVLLISR